MAVHAVLLTVLVLGGQAQPGAPAQPPPPGTGLIVGRVVDGGTGRPIPGAIVALGADTGAASSPRAMTNANGQFVFRKVAKGSYAVNATKVGYVDGSYGRRRPQGSSMPLQLEDAQRVSDVVIPMWRYGAITGSVTDEAGEPMIGVQVKVFQRRITAGRRRLMMQGQATTDDRGIYRMASLAPGEYLVAFVWREVTVPVAVADLLLSGSNNPKAAEIARERPSSFFTPNTVVAGGFVRDFPQGSTIPPPSADGAPIYIYPTQYYPGVPVVGRAGVVKVSSGQERENVDFSLRPVRTAKVSGTVMGPEGPVPYISVSLWQAGDDVATNGELETSVTMTGEAGDFTLIGVPAGQYTLKIVRVPRAASNPPATITTIQAGGSTIVSSVSGGPGATQPPISDDPTLFGEATVAVADRDVNDVVVTLQRGARLTGRFEFDGAAEKPAGAALTRIPIILDRADASVTLGSNFVPPGRADESGVFKTYGMPPGKYLVRAGAPSGWTLRSITSEGRDLADTPIDLRITDLTNVVVTFTDRPTKLSGIVRGTDGNADTGALVIVFPADSSGWSDYGFNPRRVRNIRPSKNGSYSLTGLPPGEYYVAAIHEEDVADWRDPQVLEDLSRGASQIRLTEGDARVQDLKTTKAGAR